VNTDLAPRDVTPQVPVDRRIILQSIAAGALAPLVPDLSLASELPADASRRVRKLHIDRRYVLFPVNSDALSRRVRLVKNGRILRSFTASLGLPAEWWAHLDASEWQGETLTLSVERDSSRPLGYQPPSGRGVKETANSDLASAITTSPTIWSPETLYKEPLRPQFHFSAKRGWINDPNGLMYHDGHFHMFFQCNPYGTRWSNMHWGHAVSSDLVHWEELPIAFYPRGEDDFPYSGAGVVDKENTSGWGRGDRPPMVVVIYSTRRGECIAYSKDDGRTWKEFEGNPVIKAERDAKLLWHPETKRWVMPVYSERLNGRPVERLDGDPWLPGTLLGISFYTSPDLKSWQERSWIEGFEDCPDLFALPVDGDRDRTKWVLTCGPGHYRVGEFDGSRFTPESAQLPGPSGSARFYAGQTVSNHPCGDVVQIAWVDVESHGASFRGLMTFPAKLSLQTTREGIRLCREPVESISSLYLHTHDYPAGPFGNVPLLTDLSGTAWDIDLTIRVGPVAQIVMNVAGDDYAYDPPSQILAGPKGALPVPLTDGRLQLRILVDRTTVEIFGDRGQAYGVFSRDKPGESAPLRLQSWQGYLEKLRVHALRSAWTLA
jgi:fructan beta-fructosidase